MDSIYYKKYIKYKSKYINLKKEYEMKGGFIRNGKFIVFFKPKIFNDKTKSTDSKEKRESDDAYYTNKYNTFCNNLQKGNFVKYDDIDYFSKMTFYIENKKNLIRPHLNVVLKKMAKSDFFWNRVIDIATDGSKSQKILSIPFINACKRLKKNQGKVLAMLDIDIILPTNIDLDNSFSYENTIKKNIEMNPYLKNYKYLILEKSMSITGNKYKILDVDTTIPSTLNIKYINLDLLPKQIGGSGVELVIFASIIGGLVGFAFLVRILLEISNSID